MLVTKKTSHYLQHQKCFQTIRDKCGFDLVPDKRIVRYEGVPSWDKLVKSVNDVTVIRANEGNIEKVIAYDKKVCDGMDRRILLIESIKYRDDYLLLLSLDGKGDVKGYCLAVTSNFNMILLQPLYADNVQIAELLVHNICQMKKAIVEKNGVWMQLWDKNDDALNMVAKMHLKCTSTEPILFTKEIVEGNMQKIFFTSSPSYYPF